MQKSPRTRGPSCRRRTHALAGALSGAALWAAVAATAAAGADLRVIAPNAVREIAIAASAAYDRSSAGRVAFAWGGSESIAKRVGDGEAFDVVLNTPQNLDALAAAGKIVPGSRTDFARSGIGVAVRAGAARPDVSSEEGLKAALRAAGTIGISSGPSGRSMTELFARLGIADEIQGRIRQPPSGAQIAELLARGEVDLGFQQVSELQHASGIAYLGPLPPSLQRYTIYSAGVHAAAVDPEAARRFLQVLVSPDLARAIRDAGMEPVPAR